MPALVACFDLRRSPAYSPCSQVVDAVKIPVIAADRFQ
jgi:hypothetical protein